MALSEIGRNIESRIRSTKAPDVIRGRFASPVKGALLAISALTLATTVACGSDSNAGTLPVTQEPTRSVISASATPEHPTPSPTAAPGSGGPNPFPTYEAVDPRAKTINPIIDRINQNDPTLTNEERNQVAAAQALDRTTTPPVIVGDPPKAEGTPIPPTKQESEKVVGPCSFITNPDLCIKGKPKTRSGREDRIIYMDYDELPKDTPINSIPGNFKVATDATTGKVIGVFIDTGDANQTTVEIYGDDLIIDNTTVRDVGRETIAKVGPSGHVRFTASALNPTTGNMAVPQTFWGENFPNATVAKPKEFVSVQNQLIVTKRFD